MPGLYEIALTMVPGVGDVNARNLVSYCGSAEKVFKTPYHQLLKIPGIGSKAARALANKQILIDAEKELNYSEKEGIKLLYFWDKNYPQRLKQCYDAPMLLYYKGTADLNCIKTISIVGTRRATPQGKETCTRLVEELKAHQVLIISGLAYGIDAEAHKAALKHGLATVGVLAHGLDRLYPSQHKNMADKMLEQGGLLTEFPSNTVPDRENFPKRNRIIAGMADATVVVEAGAKGGALITANLANDYDREVFAYPGRFNDEFSKGCNQLVKSCKAALITSAKDIELALRWDEKEYKPAITDDFLMKFSEYERKIIEILKNGMEIPIDELLFVSKIPNALLISSLFNLEMNGIIKNMPGKVYKIII